MNEIDPVEALDSAHKALKDFVQQNSGVVSTLQKLVEQYNDSRKIVADRVKATSKESRKSETMGLLSTKLAGGRAVNFDALEEIVTDEEFRTVVEINYKFRGKDGKDGKNALLVLQGRYGHQLDGLEIDVPPIVSVLGPKEVELGALEKML
jgi:hypothetical protein